MSAYLVAAEVSERGFYWYHGSQTRTPTIVHWDASFGFRGMGSNLLLSASVLDGYFSGPIVAPRMPTVADVTGEPS